MRFLSDFTQHEYNVELLKNYFHVPQLVKLFRDEYDEHPEIVILEYKGAQGILLKRYGSHRFCFIPNLSRILFEYLEAPLILSRSGVADDSPVGVLMCSITVCEGALSFAKDNHVVLRDLYMRTQHKTYEEMMVLYGTYSIAISNAMSSFASKLRDLPQKPKQFLVLRTYEFMQLEAIFNPLTEWADKTVVDFFIELTTSEELHRSWIYYLNYGELRD